METVALVGRLGGAALVASALGVRGLRKGSLDASGAAAAAVVGFLTLSSGLRYGALLLGFYFSGSKLTRVRARVKQSLDANYKPGGQRSASQVLATSLLATLIAVYVAVEFQDDAGAIDFQAAPLRSHLLAGFIGHYACCAADTWASELGVLSPSAPRLITTLARVPPGTNGGVSLLGTAASALGGAFIGALYYAATWPVGQPQVVGLGLAAGLVGSLLDSLLGATLQASYFDKERARICAEGDAEGDAETAGARQHIAGVDVLTNAQVNLVSVVLTTAMSGELARLLFSWP